MQNKLAVHFFIFMAYTKHKNISFPGLHDIKKNSHGSIMPKKTM